MQKIPISKTYSQAPITKEGIINSNITYCKKIDIHINDNGRSLPVMYWIQNVKPRETKSILNRANHDVINYLYNEL